MEGVDPLIQQGITSDRYKLIPRCLIFVRRGNSYLLIKGSQDKRIWANKFNRVGGHIEKGEDVITSAKRELLEETGLSIDLYLRGIVTVDPGGPIGVGIFVFSGCYSSGKLKSSNEGDLRWIDIDDLKDIPVVEDVEILLNRIHHMKNYSHPFFAHSSYASNGNLEIRFHD